MVEGKGRGSQICWEAEAITPAAGDENLNKGRAIAG